MTVGGVNAMATRNGLHALPARPPLTSHQSNSVPSTPHQHPREFRSRSRSPSPHTGLGIGSHSPRSVKSEADGLLATLPKGQPRCKHERGIGLTSRRRMQYDIGDAPLDPPTEQPKKALDPDQEKKLSGDMREVYDRLLPSEESDHRRLLFVQKLDGLLKKEWPDTEFHVHIFGSSGNLLCTSESDVDICIQTPMRGLESMHTLAGVLHKNGMADVNCIAGAKVPIVKLWDPELKLAADVNVNNTLALENTRMIKTYVQIDERVRPLAMIIKDWTKQRMLNDAGIGGTLSSYAWICLILNFLQTRDPPILPALHQMPHKEYKAQDGSESGFNDEIDKLRGFGAANTQTLGELLFDFFRVYSFEIDYASSVISVRHGKLLTRQQKGWDLTSKEGFWRLCIEEPFNTSRNLGNSADSTAFRGIHQELRQAFFHLAHGPRLDQVLEKYEFPVEEKHLFKKPIAGPKPTLTAAISPVPPSIRAPRGGGSMRGSRHPNSRQSNNYRRSSSGAAFGRHPYPYLASPPMMLQGMDYVSSNGSPEAMQRLQEQLLHASQVNGLHLEQLKARFAFQETQLRAAEQARSVANVHAQTVAQGSKQTSQTTSTTVSPSKTPFITGNSSPQLSQSSLMYPDLFFQHYTLDGQPLAQSTSHDGSRTNPSSPSLATILPRRAPQRSGLSAASQGAAGLRSQSQPARGLPPSFAAPYPNFAGLSGFGLPPYSVPNINGQDSSTMSQSSHDGSSSYDGSAYRTGSMALQQDMMPKEYVGYYMSNTAKAQPPTPSTQLPVFGTLPQIPQYSELAHRRNRPSQDLQLTLNGSRRASRSPSPLSNHHRTFSIPAQSSHAGLRSAPLPRASEHRPDRIEQGRSYAHMSNSPAVVNGSTMALPQTPEEQAVLSNHQPSLNTARGGYMPGDVSIGAPDALGLSGYQHGNGHHRQQRQSGSPNHVSPGLQATRAGPASSENVPPALSPPQVFPSFVDPSEQTHSPKKRVDEQTSPKTSTSPWGSNKPSVPPIDTVNASQMQGNISEPKTAPVLSPVFEAPTPSPTAARRPDHNRQTSINGILAPVNGEGGITGSSSRPAEPVPPTPLGRPDLASSNGINGIDRSNQAGVAGSSVSGGQWQQTGTRKKNRKRTKSGPSPRSSATADGSKTKIDNAPAHESERKGG